MKTHLSAYKFLWIQVLFDLPVTTPELRKAATGFRDFLLDQGFEMAQFSVYQRWVSGKERAEKYIRLIEKNIPPEGKVHILQFTDAQYKNMVTFRGRIRGKPPKNQDQLTLF